MLSSVPLFYVSTRLFFHPSHARFYVFICALLHPPHAIFLRHPMRFYYRTSHTIFLREHEAISSFIARNLSTLLRTRYFSSQITRTFYYVFARTLIHQSRAIYLRFHSRIPPSPESHALFLRIHSRIPSPTARLLSPNFTSP